MTVRAQDGAELWATSEGEGEPVLLCHGGPGLWDTLDDVAGLLAGRAAVHRWDQRGCGRSEWRGPYSVARSVADLDAVREHFGLDTVTLLGHSWGAHLALRYALAHPERVTRLVYVSGTGIGADADWHGAYKQNRRTALGAHLPRWEELRNKERTPAEDREMCVLQWSTDFAGPDRGLALRRAEEMASPWRGVNFECNATINAETKAQDVLRLHTLCAGLDVPVTVVDGAEDLRPRASVDSLEQVLPRVSRVTLAGAGHLPWAEDPEGFLAAAMDTATAPPL